MTSVWSRKGVLSVSQLTKKYGANTVLRNFSLSLQSGEIVGLVGPNGAGKTTVFNVLTGLVAASSGSADYRGYDLLSLPTRRIARLGIFRSFQELRVARLLTVADNVLLAYSNHPGERLLSLLRSSSDVAAVERQIRAAAEDILGRLGLASHIEDPAGALSYGQQKLLTIGMCLLSDSDLILLDEPVAGVSPSLVGKITDLVRGLAAEGRGVLVIEHNMDATKAMCERIVFLDRGDTLCQGSPAQVFSDPAVLGAYLG